MLKLLVFPYYNFSIVFLQHYFSNKINIVLVSLGSLVLSSGVF